MWIWITTKPRENKKNCTENVWPGLHALFLLVLPQFFDVFCFLVLTSSKIQKETLLLFLDRMMVLKGCKTTKSQRTCPSQNSWALKKLQFMVADCALRTWIQDSTLRTSFVDPVSLDSRFKIRGEQTSWIQPPFFGSWILNPAPLDSRSFSGSWSLHPM